jgi:transposase-like protein
VPPLPLRSGWLLETMRKGAMQAVEELLRVECEAALVAARYERTGQRLGYRNGVTERSLGTPHGQVSLEIPRARLRGPDGSEREWRSHVLPRYQRRMEEVNTAVAEVYLAGVNSRRVKAALRPLLRGVALSRSAVSRIVGRVRSAYEAWKTRRLRPGAYAYLFLDAIFVRRRVDRKVEKLPVLLAVGVRWDGRKELLAVSLAGVESEQGWKDLLDDLVARGMTAPVLCIIDGNPGLARALETTWPGVAIQRCTVHKLRNLESKVPPRLHDEVADDYRRMVYAETAEKVEAQRQAFRTKWSRKCPAVVASLDEAGEQLFTFLRFPPEQWRSLRTSNIIERFNGELRRRLKTQGSLPTDDAVLILLYGLVAAGHVRMRRLEGHVAMVHVSRDHLHRAA